MGPYIPRKIDTWSPISRNMHGIPSLCENEDPLKTYCFSGLNLETLCMTDRIYRNMRSPYSYIVKMETLCMADHLYRNTRSPYIIGP